MRPSRILFATLALLTTAAKLQAQPYIDLFQGFYQYAPSTKEISAFSHYRMQANIPVVFKKSGDVFLVNPIWEGRTITTKELPEVSSYKPQGLIVWFTYTKQLGHDRSLTLAAIPRWNGEKELQFSQGFQMGGAGLYAWRSGPRLQLKAGLYYNREFFGNFFIPLFGGDWTLGKKDRIFGVLPGSLTWEHKVNKTFAFGGNFRTFTNSYRVNPRWFVDTGNNHIRIDDNQLGAYLDIYAAPKWVFTLEGGMSMHRQVRFGPNTYPNQFHTPEYVPYLRACFQYRLRLDKPKR